MNFCYFFVPLSLYVSAVVSADEQSSSVYPHFSYSNEVAVQTLVNQQPFGNSWFTPSNTPYSPENTDFNRVVLELQVNSTGANFDRLCQVFINDIEIWRTSTAEPDDHGTSWTVRKDVSHYTNLFKTDRTVNVLLKNRVTDSLSGVFYVTLKAHFYNDAETISQTDGGWIIDLDDLPEKVQALTKPGSSPSSSWSAPSDDISVNVGPLDRSVNRAVVQIFASGNDNDEFWWDSSQSSSSKPSRFVDLWVGNQLAGFAAPYPVIFSGGVNPYLWKPLVDLTAFDVPSYFIDITPFLPSLWDSSTPISIKVTNGLNGEPVPSDWIITYNLLTWSTAGQSNSGTTHKPDFSGGAPDHGTPGSVLVDRSLITSASLNIGGKEHNIQWQQRASYNNTLSGNSHIWQESHGFSRITGIKDFSMEFNYPFQCEMYGGDYFRVQQTYEVTSNRNEYFTWIDSSVQLNGNSGPLQSAQSSQYLNYPGGAHYAETEDMQMTLEW